MKCVVIYYSQTGNTEMVAKKIQAGVKRIAGNCDIIKVKDANPLRLQEYDLIGIGSHCLQENFAGRQLLYPKPHDDVVPRNVETFIKDMHFVGGKHAFVFNTVGTISEYFFPTIIPMLKSRGLEVIGWAQWYSNVYLPWYAWPYPTAGHPDEIDLKEAEDFGREIAERSRKISAGETKLIPPVPEMPPPITTFPRAVGWELTRNRFQFHKDKCLYPDCRLCVDNCPADAIDLSRNPPVPWMMNMEGKGGLKPPDMADNCQTNCAFCTMICPTGAIEIDDYVEDQSQNFLDAQKEIALPIFKKTEEEGRFRRLVPMKFDITFGMAHRKHPQWIIGKGPNTLK